MKTTLSFIMRVGFLLLIISQGRQAWAQTKYQGGSGAGYSSLGYYGGHTPDVTTPFKFLGGAGAGYAMANPFGGGLSPLTFSSTKYQGGLGQGYAQSLFNGGLDPSFSNVSKYQGGSGQGYASTVTSQGLTLALGQSAKYRGGAGQGYAAQLLQGQLEPDFGIYKFLGGSGQGYASTAIDTAFAAIVNIPASKYFGGMGAGYAMILVGTAVNAPQTLSTKYAGGLGQGYASLGLNASIDGASVLAQKYLGGNGQGYATLGTSGQLDAALFANNKYRGGNGQGYALSNPFVGLDATAFISVRYRGGIGQGYALLSRTTGRLTDDVALPCSGNLSPVAILPSGPLSFCQGDSVTLTSSYSSRNVWSNGATTRSITVKASGQYKVTYTTAEGCKALPDSVVVTVNPEGTKPTLNLAGTQTLCDGDSIQITSSLAASYLWNIGATTQSIYAKAAGIYHLVSYTASGCPAKSDTVTIEILPKPSTPTISAGGPTTICTGGSVTLSAPAGLAYLWSTNESSQSITVNTGGSYTVQTIVNGCTSLVSAATAVVVNTPPTTPTISASGPTTFCTGGSVTLSAPAGFSYLWSTNETSQSITVNAGGSYTVRSIVNGCTSLVSAATVVVVNTPPSTPTISASGPTTFCTGGSVTLTAPAGLSYLWSTNETSQSINVSAGGSYSVRTIVNGCTSSVSAATVVVVNTPPTTPTISASGLTTFCTGGSVTLSAPAGLAYLWSTNETSQSITVNAGGSYTVRSIVNGCTSLVSAATVVVVNTPPSTPTITPSGPTTFCTGGSVTLSAPAGLAYLWSTNESSQSITVNTGGSYTVQTIVNGCTSSVSAATVVVVNTPPTTPTISASGLTTFCTGGSVTLSAPAGLAYLWSTNETSQSITVNAGGNYSVRTIVNGCTSLVSAATVVVVNTPPSTPTITPSGPTTFCTGGSVTLSAPAGMAYLWSTNETSQSITVSAGGSYTVRTIVNGCTSLVSAATVVVVNTPPSTPTISASGPTTFCTGGSVTLSAPAGLAYLWSTNETSQSITVNAGGNYSVRTIVNGCTSLVSAATVVVVNTPPSTPIISASGPTTFCTGGSVTLTAPAGLSYLWSTNETSQSINVSAGGSYSVRTIVNGCTSSVSAATVVVVNTPPTTPTISASGPTTFNLGGSVTLSAPAGLTYIWSTSETSQSITVTSSGSYTVQTIQNGCTSAVSLPVVVTVNALPPFVFSGIGLWTDLARWSGGVLPTTSDSATIAPGAVATAVAGFAVRSLSVQPTATLNLQSSTAMIAVKDVLQNLGTITVSGTGRAGFELGGGTFAPAIISGNTFGLNSLKAISDLRLETDLDIRATLDPNGKTVDVNNKRLTLKSSAAGTAQLLQPVGSVLLNAANTTVERYLAPGLVSGTGAWVWVGAQTSGQVVDLWSANNPYAAATYTTPTIATGSSIITFDPTFLLAGANGYRKPTGPTQPALIGVGHRVWFRNTEFFNGSAAGVWKSTGSPKLGSHNFSLRYCGGSNCAAQGTSTENGWNLIANPYAATIDWDAATGWTKTDVHNATYIFRHRFGNTASYINGVGVNSGSRYLPSGQGFMIWADEPTAALSVDPSAISNLSDPAIRREASLSDVLKVNVTGVGDLQDQIALRWDQQATSGFDRQLEARKLLSPAGVNLSFLVGNTEMAIMADQPPTSTQVYPLALAAPRAGQYSISFEGVASLSNPQWSLYLMDNQTGINTPVSDVASYAFTANQGSNNGRFSLVVNPAGVTKIQSALNNKVTLAPNPTQDKTTLRVARSLGQPTTFRISNAIGQVMMTTQLPANTAELSLDISSLAKGVYLVQAPGFGVTKLIKE